MKTARILFHFWKAALIQSLEYRASFWFGIIANAFDFTFGLVQYGLFFSVAETVAGWGMIQMLAFYAIFMTVFSLHFIFLFPNLEAMSQLVNTGQLDLILSKPVSAQLLLSFRRLSFEETGSFLAAQVLLWGLIFLGLIPFNLTHVLAFMISMVFSMSLIYSLFVFFMAVAMKTEKLDDLSSLLWSLFGLCRYPSDIYPGWLRTIFLTIIPLAFVTTVPAKALLVGGNPLVLAAGFILSVVFLLLTKFLWDWALAGYSSAGG